MAKKVLIIDDNASSVSMLVARLESAGYDTTHAPDGETGLAKMRGERPDIVLLDVRMPGMDGFQVCREAKADPKLKDIPLIFVTTASQESDIKKGMEAGCDGYITKPYEGKALLEKIKNFVKP